jgi:hypothetical protein
MEIGKKMCYIKGTTSLAVEAKKPLLSFFTPAQFS